MERAKVLPETQQTERGRRARVSGTRQMDRQTQAEHVKNVAHHSRRILHTPLPLEAPHLPGYKDFFSPIRNSRMTSTSRTQMRSFLLGYLTANYVWQCMTIKCELLTNKHRQLYIYFPPRLSSSNSSSVNTSVNKCVSVIHLFCQLFGWCFCLYLYYK